RRRLRVYLPGQLLGRLLHQLGRRRYARRRPRLRDHAAKELRGRHPGPLQRRLVRGPHRAGHRLPDRRELVLASGRHPSMLPVLLFLSPPAAGREPLDAETVEKAAQPEQEEEKPALAFEIGNIWLTPFIGPAYNPEMEFVIGAGIMLSFKSDKESPRSTISATASYGTVGAG